MKTSIIGYPRVGSLRELKFTTEKYFRGEISAEELQNTAKEIRKTQWTLQKNTGLDFIPSNDFSFYDMTIGYGSIIQYYSRALHKAWTFCTGYLFCHGKGVSGSSRRCQGTCHEKMVQHQLSLHGTGNR